MLNEDGTILFIANFVGPHPIEFAGIKIPPFQVSAFVASGYTFRPIVSNSWALGGNTQLQSNEYIGTQDTSQVKFKVNGENRLILDQNTLKIMSGVVFSPLNLILNSQPASITIPNNTSNVTLGGTTSQSHILTTTYKDGRIIIINNVSNGIVTFQGTNIPINYPCFFIGISGQYKIINPPTGIQADVWSLNGNSGINNQNFIGTLDDKVVKIKSNNTDIAEFSKNQIDLKKNTSLNGSLRFMPSTKTVGSNSSIVIDSTIGNLIIVGNTTMNYTISENGYKDGDILIVSNSTSGTHTIFLDGTKIPQQITLQFIYRNGLFKLIGKEKKSQYVTVSGSSLAIPKDVDYIVIESASQAFTVTLPSGTTGQEITIENITSFIGTITAIGTNLYPTSKSTLIFGDDNWSFENNQQDLVMQGQIKPDNIGGSQNQVLTNLGNGKMKWENNNGWNIMGNANTNSTNFIGTSDNNDVVLKRNNVEKMRISDNGIELANEIKPNGANGLQNQVLTSTGNGTMQWSNLSSDEETSGSGTWGDCSLNSITGYQPVANENSADGDLFGFSVSISGNYAIVGAPKDDEGFIDQGSATIYKRNSVSGIWEQQGSKLINSNPTAGDKFGFSVSISGDFVIVGAPEDDFHQGSATIFKRNLNTNVWEQLGSKITNINPQAGDEFGYSVSIDGNYAIVGAPYDDENNSEDIGSVVFIEIDVATNSWSYNEKHLESQPYSHSYFGSSVSISGEFAIVGAPGEDYPALGTVTSFKRFNSLGAWQENDNIANQYSFGNNVSLSGNYAIISMPYEGKISIFKWESGSWVYKRDIYSSTNIDELYRLFISGDYLIISNLDLISGQTRIFRNLNDMWLLIETLEGYRGSVSIDHTTKRFILGNEMSFFGKIK
jgi:hypothetical protein